MTINELQKQTNTNIQEKANLIWESATHLVGLFKPHEYGKVILPLTVLKRFDDALAPTKQAVLDMKKKLDAASGANEKACGRRADPHIRLCLLQHQQIRFCEAPCRPR